MAVDKLALSSMNPASPYGTSGQTAKARMDELVQQRQRIKALAQPSESLLEQLPEQDLVSYFERLKVFGEYPAMQWLAAKYGKQ